MSTPSREECIANAARIYEGILADPVRAAEIRAHMAQYDATQTADEPLSHRGSTRARRPGTTRRSA